MSLFQRFFGRNKFEENQQQGNIVQPQKAEGEQEAGKNREEENLPTFKEVSTIDPKEAVDILFTQAMAVVPVLSDTQFRTAFNRMCQSWGSLPLVEGTKSEVRRVILRNAKILSRKAGFKHFSINVCLANLGYKDEEAAQMWAWIGAGGLVVHLWKTEDAFHAFGRPDFLTRGPS